MYLFYRSVATALRDYQGASRKVQGQKRKICHPAHLRATAHFGAQALEIVENAGLPTESANSRVGGVSFCYQRLHATGCL